MVIVDENQGVISSAGGMSRGLSEVWWPFSKLPRMLVWLSLPKSFGSKRKAP
jgi:hypothetical protein